MSSGLGNIVRSLAAQIPTAVVLVCLAGLGYWGVAHDWAVPKFSALLGAEAPAEDEPGITLTPDPAAEKLQDPIARQVQGMKLRFPSPEAVRRAGVQCAAVQTRPMARYIQANGAIEYDQTIIAHLSIPVQGIVWQVDKHLGEAVKKGDILALVESADVGKAKADFQMYMVLVDVKRKIFNQLSSRADANPPVKIQEADAALREARIKLLNAEQTLVNLGFPVRMEDFEGLPEERLVEKVRVLGLPESYIRSLDRGQVSANLIPLRAPFDGIVIDRDMVKGEFVNSMKPQFTVADVRKMWVLLDVRAEDTGELAPGQEVVFRADSVPGQTATGRVNWISTEVDEKTRTVKVRAEVENPHGRLRAHTFGTGRILVRPLPQALAVPDDAVQAEGSCRMVFVRLADDTFQARLIQTGVHDEGCTQILSGVAPGEEVVTTASHALKSEVFKSRMPSND